MLPIARCPSPPHWPRQHRQSQLRPPVARLGSNRAAAGVSYVLTMLPTACAPLSTLLRWDLKQPRFPASRLCVQCGIGFITTAIYSAFWNNGAVTSLPSLTTPEDCCAGCVAKGPGACDAWTFDDWQGSGCYHTASITLDNCDCSACYPMNFNPSVASQCPLTEVSQQPAWT